jgi:hypothetical protein
VRAAQTRPGASASCTVFAKLRSGQVVTARYRGDATHTASTGTTVFSEHPTIYRVSFRGGPTNPEIVVYGKGFGRRPAPDPQGGTSNFGQCGPIPGRTGNDFGSELWLGNHGRDRRRTAEHRGLCGVRTRPDHGGHGAGVKKSKRPALLNLAVLRSAADTVMVPRSLLPVPANH